MRICWLVLMFLVGLVSGVLLYTVVFWPVMFVLSWVIRLDEPSGIWICVSAAVAANGTLFWFLFLRPSRDVEEGYAPGVAGGMVLAALFWLTALFMGALGW